MAASVMTTFFMPAIGRGLAEFGFERNGKMFKRSEGDLHAIVEVEAQRSLDASVRTFRVEWGVVPIWMARFLYGENFSMKRLSVHLGMRGPALVPPPKYYGGSFPKEREIDQIWKLVEQDQEDSIACAEVLLKSLNKGPVTAMVELLRPGMLLEEILAKRDERRVRYSWTWQGDAVWALLEDGPIDHVRSLLGEAYPDPENPFRMRVEAFLAARAASGNTYEE